MREHANRWSARVAGGPTLVADRHPAEPAELRKSSPDSPPVPAPTPARLDPSACDPTPDPSVMQITAATRLCPRQDESAGKKRSTRTRPQGWLKTAFIQAAWAAVKKKDSYLRAQFLRLKSRRGAKKAIVAVAASMLTAAYHMIKSDARYQDLGADYFQQRSRKKAAFRLVQRLQRLGYAVHLHAAAWVRPPERFFPVILNCQSPPRRMR